MLEIDGTPSGAVFLDGGYVTFARASLSPDLAARLLASLRPAPWLQALLLAGDRPDHDLGTMLVEHRCISGDDLRATLRSVVIDAIIALTASPADDTSVAGIRFVSASEHWAGGFCRLRLAEVRAEAGLKAARMAEARVAPAMRLRLCDLDSACAVLTREQWAVACEINGSCSVSDVARRSGLALYDTVDCIAGLIDGGLCAPVAAPSSSPPAARQRRRPSAATLPDPDPARAADSVPPPDQEGAAPPAATPRPRSRARAKEQAGAVGDQLDAGAGRLRAGADQPVPAKFTQLPTESLRRVLDGLRRLS